MMRQAREWSIIVTGTLPAWSPTVSVVISAYTSDRWEQLVEAVASVARQPHPGVETIVVVDHNPELLARAGRELAGARVVANAGARGLSGARNSGVAVATGDLVAFLDDDARAEADWLERLLVPYRDPDVIAVGGRVEPAWQVPRPSWFPREFDWVVGCSYLGMPAERSTVRNVIGANMSFRREVFAAVGGFPDGIGRVGTLPVGCEETELCIRARRRLPGRQIVYEPAATVTHLVTETRAQPRYFLSRCLAEGRSKAAVAALAGSGDALETERRYVSRVLPAGMLRGVTDVARGDVTGLARSSAIALGVLVTTVGYVLGLLVTRRGGSAR
jgi:GT2 family glycosyltransferase